jgi:hypothetical protein
MNQTVTESSSLKLVFQDAHDRRETIRRAAKESANQIEAEIIQDCHRLLKKLEQQQQQEESRKRAAHNM